MELEPIVCQIQTLSIGGLQILLQSLFAREGFGDVELMGRYTQKQKSKLGGFELRCRRSIGPIHQTILIKVIMGHQIRVRSLAEMAGNVDRFNADHGLVITTTTACKSAIRELPKFTKSPIHILESRDLAELLVKHRFGVREHGEPNYAYFSALNELAKRSEPILKEVESWT